MDKTIMGSAKPDGSVVGAASDGSADFAAGTLERRGKKWIMQTGVASDLIIQLGNHSFRLHKLPMVSRSGYINRLVFERKGKADSEKSTPINLDNVPGGVKTFELVVRFCYGLKLDLTASNIALCTVLKSCEAISPWAKQLKILNRCSEAIAWKACTDHNAFSFSTCDAALFGIQGIGRHTQKSKFLLINGGLRRSRCCG
ncbi:root phototropism protein 3-like [Eucalyptus grandis]|uniref:root phototropism protein 3-like n=1 Tax=Eucalyptus grandis TaxID=71139 RepID=UPI00192E9F69|nr:root phototropism protein 3-like [Eucalyptus grandis]